MRRPLLATLALTAALGATTAVPAAAAPVAAAPHGPGVRLLGEQVLPFGLRFAGTTVGGLSGLDRDPRTGTWYLISDDRSDLQPARFYTADVDVDARGLHGVRLTGTTPLRRQDGTVFPKGSVDPEDIRVDPLGGGLYWTTEGERLPAAVPPVIVDPATNVSGFDGRVRRTLAVPAALRMSAGERGPRRNEVLEGLTLPLGGAVSVTAMEGSLIQDGPSPTLNSGALTRVTVQTRFGGTVSQYAYPADPIVAAPVPPGGFATNGVVAILDDGPGRFLVLERSFAVGAGNSVRLYRAHVAGASNVARLDSLAGVPVRPMRKELVADLGDLDLTTVDNVEGMAWGPRLGGGERALLLVSDDNFSPTQVTQVIAVALR